MEGILPTLERAVHYPNEDFVIAGDMIAVEGTTSGRTSSGVEWQGGQTPAGRFCNVFVVTDGLIKRMHIYLDPDYGSADAQRFLWPDRSNGPW